MKISLSIKVVLLFCFMLANAYSDQPRFKVAFPQDTLSNDYRFSQVKDVENAFKRYPSVYFTYSDAGSSTPQLIKNIEDHVESGIDLLMVSPDNAALLAPVISRFYRQGIPVVMVDRAINSKDYTSLVHPDNQSIARRAAHYMMSKFKKGTILMLKGVPGASVTHDRTKAFVDEIKKNLDIKIISRTGNFIRSDTMKVISDLIDQGINFDAIYSQSDSMLSGVRYVFDKRGIDYSSMLMVGIDYIDEARKAIRSGKQSASFTYSLCGKESVDVAMKILNKKKVPNEIIIDSVLVTRENVDSVEPIF